MNSAVAWLPIVLAISIGTPVRAEPSAGVGAQARAVAIPDPMSAALSPEPATDRLLLHLTPAAAATARGLAIGTSAHATHTGLPAIDATLSQLGGVWLEREFPGEVPPAPGSELPDLSVFWIAHLPAGVTYERAMAAFSVTTGIERAETIAAAPVTAVPNDSLWSRAWYFNQGSRRDTHAPEAWNLTTGDTSVVMAIVDTGVLPYHPDLGGVVPGLSGQIWTNWAEASGLPGVDDDGNGYVDDIHGWDFVGLSTSTDIMAGEDWRDPDNDPNDFAGHGTAVAGVAGALTNNSIGVSGTVWNTRIMPLRAGWSSNSAPFGQVDLSFAAQAILYAARKGASVINCSFATIQQGDIDAAVTTAIRAGATIVFAAGNNGSVHAIADRDDIIAVTATDQDDKVTLFSNRGSYVDLCAPGVNLVTTLLSRADGDSLSLRQSTYSLGAAGTSFSAPLVSGAVALLQSYRRARGLLPLSPQLVQMRLRETADDISGQNPTLSGYGDGRLNLFRVLTDPPTSMGPRAGGRTIGPGVVVEGASGRGRVAFALNPGKLLMMDGTSGDTLWLRSLTGAPLGGVSGADLGGGRGPGLFVASGDGVIEGYDLAGNRLPGWPVTSTPGYIDTPAEPVLGDLDGDGELEVLWGGNDGYVWAWHADGQRVAGFPRRVGSPGRNVRLALSDFDAVAGVEIVAATPSGAVHLLSGNGQEWPGWPIGVLANPTAPAILRSPDADGPEIILAAGAQVEAWAPDATRLWRVLLPGPVAEGPVAGDLDGDGVDEIVLPVQASTRLVVLSAEGAGITGSWDITSLPLGPPVIGPLRGGATGVAIAVGGGSLLQAHLVAVTATGAPMVGYPKPGRCGLEASLADLDGDGRTEIAIGAGGDSALYIYDAGVGSWKPTAGGWPTTHANSARTGSRLYTPAPPAYDDAPPALVTNLLAEEVGPAALTLRWSAPADPGPYGGAAEYDLRRAAAPLDDANFTTGTRVSGLPAPAHAGSADSARVTGLKENTTYWFALRSRDAADNWSAVSAPLSVTTTGDRPAAVQDLRVRTSSDTALALAWTATGDDGMRGRPQRYLIRGGPVSAGPPSFEGAPIRIEKPATSDAGGIERASVGGLVRARRYWFALEAVDAAGNISEVSNLIDALTGPLGAKLGVAIAAGAQPAHAPVDLFWQGAAGASGSPQRIRIYDVTGRLRRTLVLPAAGEGVVSWDGRDDDGRMSPAGFYFAQLASAGWRAGARIALLR